MSSRTVLSITDSKLTFGTYDAVALIAIIAAYSYQSILPSFNPDDVIQVQWSGVGRSIMSSGRWGYAFVYGTLFGSLPAPFVSTLLGGAFLYGAYRIAAGVLEITDPRCRLLFIGVSGISVYYGLLFDFDSTRVAFPLGNFLAVSGMALVLNGRYLWGTALMMLGPAFYTPASELAALLLVLWMIAALAKDESTRSVLTKGLAASVSLMLSLIIYLYGTRLVYSMFNIPLGGRSQLNPTGIIDNSREILGLIKHHSIPIFSIGDLTHISVPSLGVIPLGGNTILPDLVIVGITAAMISFLYAGVYRIWRKGSVANVAIFVVLNGVALITPFFLIFASVEPTFPSRSLYAFSMLHGFWVAATIDHLWTRKTAQTASDSFFSGATLLAGAIILLINFVEIQQNTYIRYLSSQSDLLATNRIIYRVEEVLATAGRPFVEPVPIAVVYDRDFPDRAGPIDSSVARTARQAPWSRDWIFRLIDHRFVPATMEQRRLAQELASERGEWPAEDSVFLHGDVVVVVISN